VEEVPEPEGGSWAKAGPPSAPRRLPGFTFRAWLAVIAARGGQGRPAEFIARRPAPGRRP
jgi:hypothetical protein